MANRPFFCQELTEVLEDEIYVIGGIVDRSVGEPVDEFRGWKCSQHQSFQVVEC